MDFARDKMSIQEGLTCGVYEPLDPRVLPPLYVAYSEEFGEPTEVLHNNLRARYDKQEPEVIAAMQAFADLAQEARDVLLAGRSDQLSQLVDRNFDLRQSICQLPEKHVAMIHRAQRGASAKFAGSGGAIIGVYQDDQMFQALRATLGAMGCRVLKPKVTPKTPETPP